MINDIIFTLNKDDARKIAIEYHNRHHDKKYKCLNKICKKIIKYSSKGFTSLYYSPFWGRIPYKNEIVILLRSRGFHVVPTSYTEDGLYINW
jgi:hypothetical protein